MAVKTFSDAQVDVLKRLIVLPRVGVTVRCERAEPGRGTWKRYVGRTGTVVSVSRQRFEDGSIYIEVGVDLNGDGKVTAWFLPSEVTVEAPQRPLRGAKALEAV